MDAAGRVGRRTVSTRTSGLRIAVQVGLGIAGARCIAGPWCRRTVPALHVVNSQPLDRGVAPRWMPSTEYDLVRRSLADYSVESLVRCVPCAPFIDRIRRNDRSPLDRDADTTIQRGIAPLGE